MHGMSKTQKPSMEICIITPDDATKLLEANQQNRPLRQPHVNRIAREMSAGRWKFNGDTIKIADTGDVLDGQHRLWAIIESRKPIDTIVVHGIKKEAFSTIDTIRQTRTGADVLALNGIKKYRIVMASGLSWLIRLRRGVITDWSMPHNKIENSDIEVAAAENPDFSKAVERVMRLKGLCNPSLFAFLYYVISNRNYELAERMVTTLEDPAGIGVTDPFFRLRSFLTADHHKRKDPLMILAVSIKAINFADAGQKVQSLSWRCQGKNAEPFPTIGVKAKP